MHGVGSRRDPGHQPCCCSPRPQPWNKARPAFSCCGGSCHTLLLILESLEHVAHLLPCPRGPLLADPSWRPLLSWLVLSLPRCPLGVVQREEAHGVCQPPAPHRRFPAPSRCTLRPAPGRGKDPREGPCAPLPPLCSPLSLPAGAVCGPLRERCCCRGEEGPGDLQQMAPDRGDGGRRASAGIPAEPQVTPPPRRRVPPHRRDGRASTATSTARCSRAPSPARRAAAPASVPLRGASSPVPPAPFIVTPLLYRSVMFSRR